MIADPLLTPIAVYGAAYVLIPMLIQVIKGAAPAAWWRFAPLLSILLGLGVAVGVAVGFPEYETPWIVRVVHGLGTGLGATGLFSSLKANGVPIPGPGGR